MQKNRQSHILKAFDCPYPNAFTKGVNNAVQIIKQVAYGYRNFRNFRARIVATVNS